MLRDRFNDEEHHAVARFLIETTELQRAHVARLKDLQPESGQTTSTLRVSAVR